MSTLPEPRVPEWQQPQMFYGKPLTFNPRNHRYTWDGKPVPSVTTILGRLGKGDALIQWAANCAVDHVANAIIRDGLISKGDDDAIISTLSEARKAWTIKRDDAADIGTRVHAYARGILEGKSPPEPLDGPAQKGIEAFWRWVEQHRIEPYAVERRVMSRQHMYAGTCDFYGLIDGHVSVLDFKTGNGVYDEAWWQTSAYSIALDEEMRCGAHWRWIVHLNKTTGECGVHCRNEETDYRHDMAVWLQLVELDKALRAARKHPQPRKAA